MKLAKQIFLWALLLNGCHVCAQMAYPNAYIGVSNFSNSETGVTSSWGTTAAGALVLPLSEKISLSGNLHYTILLKEDPIVSYKIVSPIFRLGFHQNIGDQKFVFNLGFGNSTFFLRTNGEVQADSKSRWNQGTLNTEVTWIMGKKWGLALGAQSFLPNKTLPSAQHKSYLVSLGLKYQPLTKENTIVESDIGRVRGVLACRIGSNMVKSNFGVQESSSAFMLGLGLRLRLLENMHAKILVGTLGIDDTKNSPIQKSVFMDGQFGVRLAKSRKMQWLLNLGSIVSKRTLWLVSQHPDEETYLFLTKYAEIEWLFTPRLSLSSGYSSTPLNRKLFDDKPTRSLLMERGVYAGLQFYF